MNCSSVDTAALVRRAITGERCAIEELLARHRDQLRRMIAVRIDPRVKARVDPSDIIQEVLAEASEKMGTHFQDDPTHFYLWLRQLAWDRLARLHRHHIHTQKRSVSQEAAQWEHHVDDESVMELAASIAASESGPSRELIREELRSRVRTALVQLPSNDREVIVLRFFERLGTRETAAVLGTSVSAVKSRQFRAIAKLRQLIGDLTGGSL